MPHRESKRAEKKCASYLLPHESEQRTPYALLYAPKPRVFKGVKRKLGILALVVFSLSVLLTGSVRSESAYAAAGDSVAEEIRASIEQQMGQLDTGMFDKFLKSLDDNTSSLFGSKGFADMIVEITSGEGGDIGTFVDSALSYMVRQLLGFVPMLASIVIVALLSGVLSGLKTKFLGKSTGEIVHYVCYLTIVLIVISMLLPALSYVERTVGALRTLMNVLFPIILTLMTASGGVMSGKLFQPLSAVLAGGVCEIVIGVVLPLFVAATVLSVISHLSGAVSLNKLTEFFKSAALWINGITFTVFFGFLSVQGVTAASYDGISVRAAKYAIGNSVPIIGSYLKEGFDLILGSLVILKNSVGVCGMLLILGIMIFPLIQVVLLSLGLELTAGIVEPMADGKISSFLMSAGKNLNMLVAALLGVAFMFFITLMLFIVSSNAVLA